MRVVAKFFIIGSALLMLDTCCGQMEELSLLVGIKPLPSVARKAIVQAQWAIEADATATTHRFENIYNNMISWSKAENNRSQCQDSLMDFAFDLFARKAYTNKVLDATGKLESGLLLGNYKWYGRYHECMSISEENFQGKWCSFVSGQKNALTNTVTGLTIGICLPDTCDEENINAFINKFKKNDSLTLTYVDCPVQPTQWKAGDVIFTIVLSILVILLVIGTSLDMFLQRQQDKRNKELSNGDVAILGGSSSYDKKELADWKNALLAFSIIKNTRTLLSVEKRPGTIDCIHGIRFISMTWVVLGHSFIFAIGGIDNFMDAYNYLVTHIAGQAIMNAYFSVDSFFFLSGLLIAYLSLKGESRLKINHVPMMYLQRYLRLTPAYAFLILFTVGLFGKLGDGPIWPATVERNCDACVKYWWTDLLYINNLHPSSLLNECFSLGWYLANDMQFFLLAPISLLLYKRWRYVGLGILMWGVISSMIVTGVISAHYQLQPLTIAIALLLNGGNTSNSNMPSLDEAPGMSQEDIFWSDTYAKPWCRIGVYLIGMMTGCLLATTKCSIKITKVVAFFGWAVATVLGLSVVYGTWWYVHHITPMETSLAAFYDAVSRPVWACALAWVVIACVCGYGGPVNSFLSWKALIPLSRLTFCTYLIHPTVIEIWYGTSEVDIHFSVTQLAFSFIAILTIAIGAAYILSMLAEAPFVNLVKFFSEKQANRVQRHQLLVNETAEE